MVTLDQDPLFSLPGEVTAPPEAPEDRFERPIDPNELQRMRANARELFAVTERESAAYLALGGGIEEAKFKATDLVYGKFLDNLEPWKTDVDQAFTQFNLPMLLDPDTLPGMTIDHKRVLAHHFTHYVDALGSRSKVLKAPGMAASEKFADYGFNGDDAKARAYGEELKDLHGVLTRSPVHDVLRKISIKDKPRLAQREAFLKVYKRNHGVPVLVLDKQSNRYRFMPVDDRVSTAPSQPK